MTELVKQSKKAFGVKGGVFEQFAGSAASALSKGWKGGQLIPGVGLSDTSKFGGSGKQIIRGAGVQAAAAAGGAVGAGIGYRQAGWQGAKLGGRIVGTEVGGRAAKFTGSNLYEEARERIAKRNKDDKSSKS